MCVCVCGVPVCVRVCALGCVSVVVFVCVRDKLVDCVCGCLRVCYVCGCVCLHVDARLV